MNFVIISQSKGKLTVKPKVTIERENVVDKERFMDANQILRQVGHAVAQKISLKALGSQYMGTLAIHYVGFPHKPDMIFAVQAALDQQLTAEMVNAGIRELDTAMKARFFPDKRNDSKDREEQRVETYHKKQESGIITNE